MPSEYNKDTSLPLRVPAEVREMLDALVARIPASLKMTRNTAGTAAVIVGVRALSENPDPMAIYAEIAKLSGVVGSLPESEAGQRRLRRSAVVSALQALAAAKPAGFNTHCLDRALLKALGPIEIKGDSLGGFLASIAAGKTPAPGLVVTRIGAVPVGADGGETREVYSVMAAPSIRTAG